METSALQRQLAAFAAERSWEEYHTPKNLVMALSGEAGELTELFQWLTPDESLHIGPDTELFHRVRDEIADVQIYLLRLADLLNVDLEVAVKAKIEKNAIKYPPIG